MAKAAPSKKTAKAAKSATTGGKKKAKKTRKETFNSYIHKVLKQVHPGESERESARPAPHCPQRLSCRACLSSDPCSLALARW